MLSVGTAKLKPEPLAFGCERLALIVSVPVELASITLSDASVKIIFKYTIVGLVVLFTLPWITMVSPEYGVVPTEPVNKF